VTKSELARPLDAVANQMQAVAGVTTELRRLIGADAPTLVEREGAVDRGVRLLKRWQPKNPEQAQWRIVPVLGRTD
jgi:hypothetical protein